ncbi:MAG: caspase family protein [Bacteroidota bacterium]|nr:caspase family protein [Bacteroidota bacterium]
MKRNKASTAKGYSLHIGINKVDPNHYQGWDGELTACEFDAKDMNDLAKSKGFNNRKVLLTKQATRNAVISELTKLSKKLVSGDILFISYSGHGGQLPDKNNDENDNNDETWVLYNGEIVDDELYSLYSQFASGVRIIVLSDSCHSGSVVKQVHYSRVYGEQKRYRAMPNSVAARTYRANQSFYDKILSNPKLSENNPKKKTFKNQLKASVRLISGCMDNQLSLDGSFNGLFTETFLNVWNNGSFKGTYGKLASKINQQMPADQTPNHLVIGSVNSKFNSEQAFSV